MGSKRRIAKYIIPVMMKNRTDNQYYVEPFVGGGNSMYKVDGNRIGADIHYYLIEALKLIRDNPDSLPTNITEEIYYHCREHKELYKDAIVGYLGFSFAFGGKWLGTYMRRKRGEKNCPINEEIRNRRAKNKAILMSRTLQGVDFYNVSYDKLDIPPNSIIYCDPPYENTTGYKDSFTHEPFWNWCRLMVKEGHSVFVSHHSAPDDFVEVWGKDILYNPNGNNVQEGHEGLYVPNPYNEDVEAIKKKHFICFEIKLEGL